MWVLFFTDLLLGKCLGENAWYAHQSWTGSNYSGCGYLDIGTLKRSYAKNQEFDQNLEVSLGINHY